VDPDSDPAHCGRCDNACGENQACEAGSCVLSCPGGQSACDGECVDTSSDVEHCGACGNACFDGQLCVDGACVCPDGLEACDGECVDTSSHVEHCGACGNACFDGQLCVDGACVCPDGLEACDGACVDTSGHVEHCGACGNACFNGQLCAEGACVCPGATEACSDECVDLSLDVRHCGSCDNACVERPNAEPPTCRDGGCVTICLDGYGDCDGDEVNGCEIALAVDASNCGSCGNDCLAKPNVQGATCSDGGCDFVCQEEFADCDGLDENGCEASLSSLETCGSCTNDCTTLPNVAQASCDAGACGIVECVEGWLDCDGDAGNGCETEANLKDSCGACNTTCFACSESTCVGAKEVLTTQASTTCAILEDGSLWCWGNNQEKQIDDSAINPVVPTRIPLPQRAETLGGYIHHCAVLEDGTLACWGRNDSGQLGDGTLTSRSQPVVVPMLGGVVQVGGGFRHTCALTLQGEVYCWGANYAGQLGVDPNLVPMESNAIKVPGLSDVKKIAVGFESNCALLHDSTLRCWGGNSSGQLGIGSESSWVPVVDPGLVGVVDVTKGQFHACAVLASGDVVCWGANYSGQIGFDSNGDNVLHPTAIPAFAGASKVGAGAGHTCALLATGSLSCLGSNFGGEIGNGTSGTSNEPPHVLSLAGVVDFSLGNGNTCALVQTGEIYCWGQNWMGQIGAPPVGAGMPTPTLVLFP